MTGSVRILMFLMLGSSCYVRFLMFDSLWSDPYVRVSVIDSIRCSVMPSSCLACQSFVLWQHPAGILTVALWKSFVPHAISAKVHFESRWKSHNVRLTIALRNAKSIDDLGILPLVCLDTFTCLKSNLVRVRRIWFLLRSFELKDFLIWFNECLHSALIGLIVAGEMMDGSFARDQMKIGCDLSISRFEGS